MIKTEVIRKVIMEKEVIAKFHKLTKKNDMEGFVKVLVDWIYDNEVRFSPFYVPSPEYKDDEGKSRPLSFEGGPTNCYNSTYDCTYDITGMCEEDFADWIYKNSRDKKFFIYKGCLIKPTFNIRQDYTLDDHRCGPQFVIYYPEEVKEIK